ncbi:endonuclease [Metabacillus sp. KIGAM252]|uniref:Endonuclease n=1 Tax=Metabacillus flavus TaxID=2823519 RepID=A0ABS5LF52_9BACI|nr:LAGLIDADG family homing endonuclease [Metabacillus flavus]MBS2969138.1 endonuclease [Metabacillus flavus]
MGNEKKRRNGRKRTMEIEDMIKQYQEGKGTKEIAEAANVSQGYVRLIFREHNVTLRPFGHWHRKYQLNEHYFKTWSNNMAYILGFFYADGFIASAQQTVSFAQKDKTILEQIKKEMQSDQVLYQNKQTGVFMLNLNSKIMKDDLIQLFGISSNKSSEAVFPEIPDEYLNHFIRGYFDGDGYVNPEKNVVSFVGGSQQYLQALLKILQNKGFNVYLKEIEKSYSRVIISGKRSIYMFGQWIYSNRNLYLKRKYELFQQQSLNQEQLEDRKLSRTKKAVLERKKQFAEIYKINQSIEDTCAEIGIQLNTYQKWLRTDATFQNRIKNDFK